jgi:autotransporter-associated beta strand protein
LAGAIVGAAPALAADGTWNTDAGVGNLNWSNASNWLSTVADGTGSIATFTFNITNNRTITIDGTGSSGSRTIGILNIGDPNGSHQYVIAANNANTLTFDNTGSTNAQVNLTAAANGAGTYSISAPVILADSLDIDNDSNRDFNLTGVVSGFGDIRVVGTANNSVSVQNINNTFTGNLHATSTSRLQIAAGDGSAGNATNDIYLANGAELRLSSGWMMNPRRTIYAAGASRFSVPFALQQNHITGNFLATGLFTSAMGSSTLMLSGNNTFGAGINSETMLIFSSQANIGGSNSAITYSGFGNHGVSIIGSEVTNLTSHAMTFATSFNLDVQDPNNVFTWDKTSSVTGNSSGNTFFTKTGRGTAVVTAIQNFDNVNGNGVDFAMNGGTLRLALLSGGRLKAGSNVAFGGGTLHVLGGGASPQTQTLGNVRLDGGGGTLRVDNANGSGNLTVALGNFNTLNTASSQSPYFPGSSLNIQTANAGTGAIAVTTTEANDVSGIVGGGRVVYNGDDWATSSGGTLSAYGGYTALTPAGTLGTVNYRQTGAGTVTATQSVNTLKISTTLAGQSLVISADQRLSVTTGGVLFTGDDDYSITGGSINGLSGATNSEVAVHHYGDGELTIGSVIVNGNGASTFNKAGTGTLVLAGANLYGGATYVTGGVLSISADANINGAAGVQTNVTSSTSSATVTVSAPSLADGVVVGATMLGRTITAISGTSGAYTITLGNTAGTSLTNQSASFANAANLLLNGGTLRTTATMSLEQIGSGGATGTGGTPSQSQTTTVRRGIVLGGSGGTFDVASGTELTVGGVVSANGAAAAQGALVLTGGGTLHLSGANTFGGGVEINHGVLRLQNNSAINASGFNTVSLGNGAVATLRINGARNIPIAGLSSASANAVVENGATGAATLTVVNGGNNSFAGVLQNGAAGTLALTKGGAGKLTLTNNNTYTGATNIYGGILQVNGSLAATSAVTVADFGTLAGTGSVGNVSVTDGGTVAPGASVGTLTAGDVAFSGGRFAVEVNANNDTADRLNGSDISLGAGVTVFDLSILAGSGAYTESFTIINNTGLNSTTGYFAGLQPLVGTTASFNTGDGLAYTINYAGGTGNDVVIGFTSVPEPGALSLIGLAGAALLGRRRRKSGTLS